MTDQPTLDVDYAVKSYRYLRLTVVVMVVIVMVAVLAEEDVFGRGCWLRSFSAYYYTPAHSVFIAALVTIGACLIAVKGTDPLEDACLNVAGILAPIVAFVPTNRPGDACDSVLLVSEDFTSEATRPFVTNSVFSYALVGLAVVALAYILADRHDALDKLTELKDKGIRNEQVVGLLVALALTAGLIGWYLTNSRSFLENAHDRTAIAMFIAVGFAALTRARRASRGVHRFWYWVAVAVMLSGVLPLLVKLADDDFQHEVIWIEVIELAGFCIFWIVQTVEHWNLKITSHPSSPEAEGSRV